MLGRINRFLILVMLLSGAIYFVTTNIQPITIRFAGLEISGSIGIIVLGAVGVGIGASLFVTLLFSIGSFYRESQRVSAEKIRLNIESLLLRAKTSYTAGDRDDAQRLCAQILRAQKGHLEASLLYSKLLDEQGLPDKALEVVNIARTYHHGNFLLAHRAYEIYFRSGQKGAALDTLTTFDGILIPGAFVRELRELAIAQKRFVDAKHFNELLAERLDESTDTHEAAVVCELGLRGIRFEPDSFKIADLPDEKEKIEGLIRDVRALVNSYNQSPCGWRTLGAVLKENNDLEDAAQCFTKASKLSHDVRDATEAISLWRSVGNQEKALSVARAFGAAASENVRGLVLAELYGKAGDDSLAIEQLNEFEEKNAPTERSVLLRSFLAAKSGSERSIKEAQIQTERFFS